MEKIKDFDEFEKRLKNEHIQIRSINKQQIIQSLTSHPKHKAKRISVIAVISMCLFLSVAAVGAMEFSGLTFFKNDPGSIIEVETMTEQEMQPHHAADEVSRKNARLIERLKKQLPKGKFLRFLDVEEYEKTGIIDLFGLSNNQPFKNVDEIPVFFAKNLNIPNQLLDEYNLKSGMMSYKIPEISYEEMMEITEKLQLQAKQLNRHYGVLEGDLLQEISSISLSYEVNNFPDLRYFDINISSINNRIKTNEDLSSFIELESDIGTDVYYSEEQKKLLFVQKDDTENYLISIQDPFTYIQNPLTTENNADLQQFIDVAKILLNKE